MSDMLSVLQQAMNDSQSSVDVDAQRIANKVSPEELKKVGIEIPSPEVAAQKAAVQAELLQKVPQQEPEQTEQMVLAGKIGKVLAQVKDGHMSQEQARQTIADFVRQAQEEQGQKPQSASAVNVSAVSNTTSGWAPKAVEPAPKPVSTNHMKPGQ